MPSRSEIAYFGAGPAPMPTAVLEAGAAAFVNFADSGISLAEQSHRSATANQVLADAKERLTKLLDLPGDYEIIFCHGGGTGGFASVVLNLVPVWVERRRRRAEKELGAGKDAEILERVRKEVREELRLDYLVTGSWTAKASTEAKNLLEPLGKDLVNVAVDARPANGGKFGTIPPESEWKLTPTRKQGGPGSAFVYYCDNETVDGVEFPRFPAALEATGEAEPEDERIVACDMSSNFLSRKVDVAKYGVIFVRALHLSHRLPKAPKKANCLNFQAGAQKNVGITDTTILLVRRSLLAEQAAPAFLHSVGVWSPPSVLHWLTLAKNNSLYNTLPIFSVHVAALVLKQLLEVHGPLATGSQAKESGHKADMIYSILDGNPKLFRVCPDKSVRSRMNVCFRIGGGDEALEKKFLEGAEKKGLMGLKGHRSVGGIRFSNYNAVPVANVEKLRDYMLDFVQVEGKDGS